MRQARATKCAGFLRAVAMVSMLAIVALLVGFAMHLVYTPRPTPDHVATCPGTGQEDDYGVDLQPQSDGSWLLVCTRVNH